MHKMIWTIVTVAAIAFVAKALHSPVYRRQVTREEAADLIDEFAELRWSFSDEFDMAFGDRFDDPLLQEVARDFLEIQADYERNARANNGAISAQNLARLRDLSARLRSSTNSEQ